MKIHGLQKMTLLDFPGRVACTIFTGGCNFRCPFCHNAGLVTGLSEAPTYDEKEILDFLKKRKGIIDGVCITGGEPMLCPDINEFIIAVRDIGYPVKLDTNGSFPEKLRYVIDNGLVDYVAMDIKNRKEKYALTAGCGEDILPKVEESVALLLQHKVDFEFRTTVVDEFHTPEDIAAISEWIKGSEKYYIQAFIDSGNLISATPLHAPSEQKLRQMLSAARKNVPGAELRGAE